MIDRWSLRRGVGNGVAPQGLDHELLVACGRHHADGPESGKIHLLGQGPPSGAPEGEHARRGLRLKLALAGPYLKDAPRNALGGFLPDEPLQLMRGIVKIGEPRLGLQHDDLPAEVVQLLDQAHLGLGEGEEAREHHREVFAPRQGLALQKFQRHGADLGAVHQAVGGQIIQIFPIDGGEDPRRGVVLPEANLRLLRQDGLVEQLPYVLRQDVQKPCTSQTRPQGQQLGFLFQQRPKQAAQDQAVVGRLNWAQAPGLAEAADVVIEVLPVPQDIFRRSVKAELVPARALPPPVSVPTGRDDKADILPQMEEAPYRPVELGDPEVGDDPHRLIRLGPAFSHQPQEEHAEEDGGREPHPGAVEREQNALLAPGEEQAADQERRKRDGQGGSRENPKRFLCVLRSLRFATEHETSQWPLRHRRLFLFCREPFLPRTMEFIAGSMGNYRELLERL